MIKLDRNRIKIPSELVEKSKKGRHELEEHFSKKNSQIRAPFRSQILMKYKPFLLDLSHNKCSFCESSINTIAFGDVENFRPKSVYWWLAYDWNNLFAACQLCNQKYKRTLFPIEGERAQNPEDNLVDEKALLINPAEENPENFFTYEMDDSLKELSIVPKNQQVEKRASATIKVFGLNRKELCHLRYRTISSFSTMIEVLKSQNLDKKLKNQAKDLILRMMHDSNPYLGAIRYFLKLKDLNSLIKQIHDISSPLKYERINEITSLSKNSPHENNENDIQSAISYITRIYITNYKSIKKFDFHLDPQIPSKRIFQFGDNEFLPQDIAKWMLILGENGVGKSTILEAVAIALIGEEEANSIHPIERAKNYIRRGAKSCKIELEYLDGTTSKLRILKSKGILFSTGKEGKDILIRGYGHVRLIPKEDKEDYSSKVDSRFIEVRNLFNPYHPLCDVNSYYTNLPEEKLEDVGISPFRFATQTLRDILPEIDEKDIEKDENGRIKLSISGKETFLDELSSGYQAVIILVTDLMSSLKVENLTDMREQPGIVLLDEIGSQLHPKWRMRIVKDLRKAFPRIQFIATTHEPLCLKGNATEEVIKMNRSETIQLNETIHPDISKLRVDQLLTSPLFGMDSTIDPIIEQKFKEYYDLLENEPDNFEKIFELKGELALYNTLGYTRRDQLLYDVIDTYIAENSDRMDIMDIDEKTKEIIINAWNYAKGRNQI